MPVEAIPTFTWRGARALVLLHEESMRAALAAWRRAKAAKVKLPASDNAAYASLETVLHHVLKAGRNMFLWISEKLALPDPKIDEAPEPSRIEAEADRYLQHLLDRIRPLFAGVDAKRFEEVHKDRSGHDTSLLARLEHAVVHPQRHRFQLEEMMEKR
jgi:hypothetical protein